jgi:sugar phosphate isomerase/epimerase
MLLEVKHVFTGVGAEPFSTVDKIKETAEYFSNIADQTAKHGIFVGIHNHPDEMVMVDGIPAYRRFLDECSKNVIWQVDTYWVKLAGLDPAAVINDIGKQCPSIHLKDGMLAGRQGPLNPLGDGVMDIPAMIKAAGDRTLIAEQDYGTGSMLDNVERSINYLKNL